MKTKPPNRQIFFLPDDPYYTSNINGSGLAELYKTFYDFDAEVYGRYLDQFKLSPKAPIRNFSKGMKRQVFVSLALAVRPKYLLLDEAFDGWTRSPAWCSSAASSTWWRKRAAR